MRPPPLALLLLAACAGPPAPPDGPAVSTWGTMRTVLREGRTEARVRLGDALGPDTVAVGALAGLAAEVTVVDGVAHLAEVVDSASPDGLRTRTADDDDRATLLVAADVPAWSEHPLSSVADLRDLERQIGARGLGAGPLPFRLEGTAGHLALHVLDHACPIADPDGPPPWRFAGEQVRATVVGFYAEGAGGTLTHHGQATHAHAVLPELGISGHLDAVAFPEGARLFLPARQP